MAELPVTPADCADQVGGLFDRAFRQLDTWRDAIASAAPSRPAPPAPRRGDSLAVRPADLDLLVEGLVAPALVAAHPLFIGAGFIAAPQYVHGRNVHFAWWLGPSEANPLLGQTTAPSRLDLSTRAYTEYLRDMRLLEWYSVPESTQETHVTGPYVDHLCTCEYIFTLTMPVRIGDEMVGVVGGDVNVRWIERELLPRFLALPTPAALVNEVGRVVVSTVPGLSAGDLIPAQGAPPPGYTLTRCAGTPLSIATADSPLPG